MTLDRCIFDSYNLAGQHFCASAKCPVSWRNVNSLEAMNDFFLWTLVVSLKIPKTNQTTKEKKPQTKQKQTEKKKNPPRKIISLRRKLRRSYLWAFTIFGPTCSCGRYNLVPLVDSAVHWGWGKCVFTSVGAKFFTALCRRSLFIIFNLIFNT